MATYYVDGTRPDDSGDGTSEGTAKKTLAAGFALATNNDIVMVKASATYTPTGGTALSVGTFSVIGYSGQVQIDASGMNVGVNALQIADHGAVYNLTITGAKGHAFVTSGQATVYNCQAISAGSYGFSGSTSAQFVSCYAESCGSAGFFRGRLTACRATANAAGFNSFSSASLCVADGNTGEGFSSGESTSFSSCIAFGNTSHGFSAARRSVWQSCVSYGNGGYGFVHSSGSNTQSRATAFHSASGGNTSGDQSSSNPDVDFSLTSLSADPFEDAANGNFNFNNTAGGGALLRAMTFAVPS